MVEAKKAIEVINDILEGRRSARATNGIRALTLGVEALKQLERCRENHCDTSFADLPGETEGD